MLNFFKSSFREMKHVVWPTRQETKKYFIVVLLVLIAFGLYLFVASTLFSKTLFGLRDMINPESGVYPTVPNIEQDIQLGTGAIEVSSGSGESQE